MTAHHHADDASCLFCRIAAGDFPAHEVFRDDRIVAFLDIGPIRDGHVQIIPRDHYETFDELPADLAAAIMYLAQRLARAQKAVFGVGRVGFLFTGGDIAHAHAHLVPLVEKTDITSRRYIVEDKLTWRDLPRPERGALRQTAEALSVALKDQPDS
ncbi:HIT domain-containing protein [Paracoccus caeni]|uniref:HIT domain-containing protein n=1 Tax=Paracoccus caeni TaxID=657651 RepID=A0A934SI25_9RHOB|nr:HIT domain-containing protein [Paracoccus caeni]MBK4218048.1 HIT domain-containing protein [Paracoccus caeni]